MPEHPIAKGEALKGVASHDDLTVWMMEKSRLQRRAARHMATGWPHGERAIACEMFI